MSDITNPRPNGSTGRFQFSVRSALLWVAIGCLAITNVLTRRELSAVKRELDANRPLSVKEVARQFEQNATLGPISVKVRDIRYSPHKDSYKVDFSWTDATTNKSWSSDVELTTDGYGVYSGQIRNGPFIDPLGYKEAFSVAVKSPSPLPSDE